MVTAERLHARVDDYLRVIVRTRPWTRRAEEEALAALAEWAAGDPARLELRAPGAPDAVAARCAAELRLAPEQQERMTAALRSFAAWAEAEEGLAAPRAPDG
ncbi:MAG: hypothetical protein AB1941_00745 [Gemmatimonadota bacterium]